jgi:hypothetical protein
MYLKVIFLDTILIQPFHTIQPFIGTILNIICNMIIKSYLTFTRFFFLSACRPNSYWFKNVDEHHSLQELFA